MSEVEPLVESIEHLEFDVPCCRKNHLLIPECNLPARWVGIVRCCGNDNLVCDLHLQGGTSPTGYIKCLRCGARNVDDRTRYVSVSPL